jgi:hypothetical protein
MMSEFTYPIGNILHRVVFFYHYASDETTINILAIGYTELVNDPDWRPPFSL